MFLEIFIYLLIAFGALILCITMLEKDGYMDEKYVILQNEKNKIKVTGKISGVDEEEAKRIAWIICKGKFNDIYDIAQEFELSTSEE